MNDVELEDLEDYQARRQPVCKKCGRVRPLPGQIISERRLEGGNLLPDPVRGFTGALIPPDIARQQIAGQMLAGEMAGRFMEETTAAPGDVTVLAGVEMGSGEEPEPERYDGGPCPWCGSEDFTDEAQEFERVVLPIHTRSGLDIPGAHPGIDEDGRPVMQPTMIPFYKPSSFPIILQRSVSVYGQLLGNSDVDVIKDQQNTVNRLEQKIIDRLMKAGSRITLPSNLRTDPEDGERWFLDNPKDKQLIDLYDFTGNIQYELTYLQQVYEEARQLIGITDSFQGRHDATATSGVAKQYSAAQAAGRLESKRIMKQAAYANLFEMIFRFWLAYSDEPRPVSFKNSAGDTEYEEFNRYDFLMKDEDGAYYWNDQFLFSCDTSAPLASNREAMWQETRMNLQTGAFGDPASTDTLILFWTKMEELHYPGAGMTREVLEQRKEQEQAAQMQQMAAQQAAQAAPQMPPAQASPAQGVPAGIAEAIERKAQQDAARAVMGGR